MHQSQGSLASSATLGFEAESLWDSRFERVRGEGILSERIGRSAAGWPSFAKSATEDRPWRLWQKDGGQKMGTHRKQWFGDVEMIGDASTVPALSAEVEELVYGFGRLHVCIF